MSNTTVNRERGGLWNTSLEERSAWIELVSIVLVLGGYYVTAGRMLSAGVTDLGLYAGEFVGAVVLLIIVMVAGHIAAAIAVRGDTTDERDRLIRLRAESHSAWVLTTGVFAGITAMLFSVPNVWTAHLLLLSLSLSEVLRLVLQLVSYRRGV
jgi:hypothetical protein